MCIQLSVAVFHVISLSLAALHDGIQLLLAVFCELHELS